jgi:hypothetical protein
LTPYKFKISLVHFWYGIMTGSPRSIP